MIGPIDGLELRSGFNPFLAGKLASNSLERLVAVDQANTREEYHAARKAVEAFDRTREELFALRSSFIETAQASGVFAAHAVTAFDRLDEAVTEVMHIARALPTIHGLKLTPELAVRVDGLKDEWERWCMASVMNQGKIEVTMRQMFAAVNAVDDIAFRILMTERAGENAG